MKFSIKKPGVYPKAKWSAYFRSWMRQEGLSPLMAAARLHMTQGQVINWMRGHARPSAPGLYRLAPLMGVPVEKLQEQASRTFEPVTVPIEEIAEMLKIDAERLANYVVAEQSGNYAA